MVKVTHKKLLLTLPNMPKLNMKTGDITLLSGPVGSGKTHFLKQLAGLIPLPEEKAHQLPEANLLFDVQPTLWMGQFVEEELSHALYPRLKPVAMRQCLDQWGLQDIELQTQLTHLNRVQGLRLHLATMSLSGRSLWLLDNPTACLPVSDGEQLRLDICRWAKQHACMIIVACNRWQDWQNDYTQHWHIQQRGTWPSLEQK